MFGIVDVRDVALAHSKAIDAPNVHGERIILVHQSHWMIDCCRHLQTELGKYGYKVQTKLLPGFGVRIASIFMPKIRQILVRLNFQHYFNTTKA